MENVDIDESVCRDKEQFYLILLFIVHQTPPPPPPPPAFLSGVKY